MSRTSASPRRDTRFIWWPVCLLLLGACQTLTIPAHPQSLDEDGERIDVRFLTLQDVHDEGFDADWMAAFGRDQVAPLQLLEESNRAQKRSLSGLAAALIPLAADYVVEKIEEEADRYAAQYEASQTVDDFWHLQRDGNAFLWTQRYLAVEVTRTTDAHDPAARFVFGLAGVAERDRLQIALLHAEVTSSRAKVLDTTAWSWLPVLWWQFLLDAGSEVELELALTTSTSSVAASRMREQGSEPATHELPHFDLDAASAWTAREHGRRVLDVTGLPAISELSRTHALVDRAGVFEFKVQVTERDPSNAQELLTSLAKTVREEADKALADQDDDDGRRGRGNDRDARDDRDDRDDDGGGVIPIAGPRPADGSGNG